MNASDVKKYLKMDHKVSIEEASVRLSGIIKPTPLIHSSFYSSEYGCEIWFKPENLQVTGSFKIRGA